MDEGWQILSNLIGCEHDAVEIGMRVEVEFHEMEGGFTLPYFRPRRGLTVQQGLAALRVVDLSTGIPGGYCARLLCDAGADVVKVEPPGGDPWRAWSAGWRRRSTPRSGGALFQFLHHGMRSVVGGRATPRSRRCVAGADVVIESFAPSMLDPQPWLDAHPGLVVCSITPVRPHRPLRRAPDDGVHRAGRVGRVWSGAGSVRSVPFQAGGRTSEWLARHVLRAWRSRRRRGGRRATGHGDHIDFSIAEVMTIAASQLRGVHPRARGQPADRRRPPHHRDAVGRADRSTATSASAPTAAQQFHNFLLLIERPDLIDGDSVEPQADRQQGWDEWNDIVHAWTPKHTTAEIVQLASELRIPVAPVHGGENILDCDHFVARDVFVDDASRSFKMPRRPWRMDDEDPPPPRPAPRLGEHTGAIEPHTPARRAVDRRPTSCRWRGCGCSTSPPGGPVPSPPERSPRSAPT